MTTTKAPRDTHESVHSLPSAADVPLTTRARHATFRWLYILFLAFLGAVAFELILPLAWSVVGSIEAPYSPTFITITTWLAILLLFYLLIEPIRIRPGQALWSYPPLWLAVVLGWVLAAVSEHLPVDIRPQTVAPDWQDQKVVLPIAAAFAGALLMRHLVRPRRSKPSVESPGHRQRNTTAARAHEPRFWTQIQHWISAGELPITCREDDLFGGGQVSDRIVRMIDDGRSVALLGPFGSGKSSILNLVREHLDKTGGTAIVANFDVWAVPRPEDVPRLALDRIVEALDDYVDTTAFRHLPLTYQRLVAAVPVPHLAAVLRIQNERDSIDALRRLTPILEALNARLILIIEDVERAGTRFDTRHLQRLLWALRAVPRISLILAIDANRRPHIDYSKLCDTVEIVRMMEYEEVGAILTTAFGYWLSAYGDIDPRPAPHESKLGLKYVRVGGTFQYARRAGKDTPLDHLIALLQTPRQLKHVIQRVDATWQHLHGEADLDDILIVTALRESATPVYDFLVTHMDAARHEPDDMLPRTMTVKSDWDRLLEQHSATHAIQRLVDLLGIDQLTSEHARPPTDSLQGVHLSDPTDYFRRINAEQLDAGQLPDQTVLSDIRSWQESRAGSLVEMLAGATNDNDAYPNIWRHFSSRHNNNELVELASQVAQRVLETDASEARADHPAMQSLWVTCNRTLPKDQHQDWLQTLIMNAVPVSLNFAIGLYHYWTRTYLKIV